MIKLREDSIFDELCALSFQSGRQGAAHPAPGAPYYAVGFPRHSLLPDTPMGRQVSLVPPVTAFLS